MQRRRNKFRKEETERENKGKARKQNRKNATKQSVENSNQKKIPFPTIEKKVEETNRKPQHRENSTHESFAKKKKRKEEIKRNLC